jgi:Family of unknown function (DUF5302)
MTETAKQDPKKAPAEPAATESAATSDDAQPDQITEPAATTEPVEAVEAEETVPPDLDETKRKFREALERKHQVHNDGQGKGNRDGGKINGAHGPAASRRNFRRKSG